MLQQDLFGFHNLFGAKILFYVLKDCLILQSAAIPVVGFSSKKAIKPEHSHFGGIRIHAFWNVAAVIIFIGFVAFQKHLFGNSAHHQPHCLKSIQHSRNFPKTSQPRFDIVDDLCRNIVRLGQIVEVGQRFILQPENIQAGFVAGQDLLIGKFAPAAFGVVLVVLGFGALMAVDWVIAGDEIL
ncbi:MAG: hypothetical protein ACR65R_13695 [Methylomicrobium sp.]